MSDRSTRMLPRLLRAADRRNAEYLAEIEPEMYGIIEHELAEGATVDDVMHTLQDVTSEKFLRTVRSAARWIKGQ